MKKDIKIAHYHLPGLFEFYELYRIFLSLYKEKRDWFYDWCDIGSIYGAPSDCIWGGGRVENGDADPEAVLKLLREYGISARLTFSNSLLEAEHLSDIRCNKLVRMLEGRAWNYAQDTPDEQNKSKTDAQAINGVIVHSDLLLNYLKDKYPNLYFVSSTTKVITDFDELKRELGREEFRFVVPDFRLNKSFEQLDSLSIDEKNKIEFLVNECCYFGCKDRRNCYEDVSAKNLGYNRPDHICKCPGGKEGYRFSWAMENPGFIGIDDIKNKYMPMGFSNFKIEGRGLGSAIVLEFLLYYMTKPEYQLKVREEIYLDNTLDLF